MGEGKTGSATCAWELHMGPEANEPGRRGHVNPVQRTPGGAHRIAAVSDEVAAGWVWSTGLGAQRKVL